MERLRDALELPANYICSQGTIATGMEALMVLLRRLAYPNRWSDLVPVFGRTVSELSLIFNEVKLLLCSFIFPVEVACIPLSFYHSWIWLGGVESLTVHFVFVCLILFVFRLQREVEGEIQLITFIGITLSPLRRPCSPPLFAIIVIKMIIPHVVPNSPSHKKRKQNTSTLMYCFPCISDYGWHLWQIPPPLR